MKVTLAAVAAAALAVTACNKDEGTSAETAPAPVRAGGEAGGDAGSGGHAAAHQGSPHDLSAGGLSVSVDGNVADFGAFRATIPESWEYAEPASQMRVAEFSLPPAGDDGEPAELVVFYFGEGGAGGVQANLERWIGQFETDDPAQVEEHEMAGMAVTTVDVAGRYVAPVTPGAADTHDEPNHRMYAAIIETPRGPFYFRMLGDEATVGAHIDNATALLESLEAGD
jgi:hypothetical protein